MADAPVVHIGENSAEHVAFRLMHEIAAIEDKSYTRAEWLDLYAECLTATKNDRQYKR